MTNDGNVYESCDKAVRAMDRESLEAFGRLKMTKWDEVNVIRTVVTVYRRIAKRARKRYLGMGFDAYLLAMEMCGISPKQARRMAEKAIDEAWVDDILSQTDFVTLYRFDSETERKAYRLAETLEVSPERNKEIDKALRYWTRQLAQYAINMTDYAMIQAMQDAGIKEVEWVTQHDERVCRECGAREGKVFKIDETPAKHPNCRCYVRPARMVSTAEAD